MRFSSLGSGSKGNGTLIDSSGHLILIDCGFTLKQSVARLERLGVSGHQLSAILVTHEHGDHINGVGPLARKFSIPVYATPGTARSGKLGRIDDLRLIHGYRPFTVGPFTVMPVAVPHDAVEPAQFIVEKDNRKLGVLTDLGSISAHVELSYQQCDALLLEANHDPLMLASGDYPSSLKERVGGAWGHLSNQQAGQLLQRIDCSKLQHLVVAHISGQNNRLDLAEAAIGPEAEGVGRVIYACQDQGFDWLDIE